LQRCGGLNAAAAAIAGRRIERRPVMATKGNAMNHRKIYALAIEAAEAQAYVRDFLELAAKREKEGCPLAAEAARESAASWQRAEDKCAAAIKAETENS
jgi:hypothetical protein